MKNRRIARYTAILLAILMIGVAVVSFVSLRDHKDDSSEPDAVTSATPPPTAPVVTPAQRLGASPFADFKLEEAPGVVEFASGANQIPADRIGVRFLDIQTGEVEGWINLLVGTEPYALSGDNRLTVFRRREQVFGGFLYPAGPVIADRANASVYRC
jgi:hypothetical protein